MNRKKAAAFVTRFLVPFAESVLIAIVTTAIKVSMGG